VGKKNGVPKMPTKYLTTPFARDETTQRSYKFGGGAKAIL